MAARPDEVAGGLAAFYAAPLEDNERSFTLADFYASPTDDSGDGQEQAENAAPDPVRMFAELAVALGQVQGGSVVGLVLSDAARGTWTVDLPV